MSERSAQPSTVQEPSAIELIGEIARSLVDKPSEVSVNTSPSEGGTVLHLRVDPTDVGKIIGKQGRTARSLRTILGAVSVKLHHRYTLEIIEEAKLDSFNS
ncbi:MAG: KH domain-containing protein [Acidobacteriaceae bacterium]